MKAVQQHSIGIVAGWGNFPLQIANKCKENGRRVVVAAIKHHADPAISLLADEIKWFGVGRLGGQINFLKRSGVTQVAWAGKLFKKQILFHGLGWIAHSPDLLCLRTLYPHIVSRTQDSTDDNLLGAAVKAFAKHGLQVLSVIDVAPELMPVAGCLTRVHPKKNQWRDIEFGWRIAKEMGGLDIGQSVTIRDQTILGVEAIEGTDGLIERTAAICPRGGFSLVKVAKPRQDMRFDVPTIGLRTVQNMYKAGGRAIVIEAGKTILIDRDETLRFADAHGICIVAHQAPTPASVVPQQAA